MCYIITHTLTRIPTELIYFFVFWTLPAAQSFCPAQTAQVCFLEHLIVIIITSLVSINMDSTYTSVHIYGHLYTEPSIYYPVRYYQRRDAASPIVSYAVITAIVF